MQWFRCRARPALLGITLAATSFGGGVGPAHDLVPFEKVDDGARSVSELEARDFSVPELGPDDICPVTTYPEPVFEGAGSGVRAGPIGAVGIGYNGVLRFEREAADGWHSSKILWVMDADLPPLVVRGRRIDGPGEVVFRRDREDAAPSLVLDQDASSTVGPFYRDQPSDPRVLQPGCYALQIDGPDFRSVIVFRAVLGSPVEARTREVEVRKITLAAGEAIGFGFHPKHTSVSLTSTVDGLEVCPAELAVLYEGAAEVGPYWFEPCLPLDADDGLELPPPPVDHVAVLVRSRTDVEVTHANLTIAYDAGDAFFYFAPPPLDAGATTAKLVITPSAWDVVVVDPAASRLEVRVSQHGGRVGEVELSEAARPGTARGPVEVGEPVAVQVRNPGQGRRPVAVAVTWDS